MEVDELYRLLIVTGNQGVSERISAMQGWEKLGFKPPRLRATAEEALECLQKHAIDAIAVEDNPAFDGLLAALDQRYPDLPMFPIEEDQEQLFGIMQELSRLLTRLKADDSDDHRDAAVNMQVQRERWLKKLISGMVGSDELDRQMKMYRFGARLDLPCVLARLGMTDEDGFMSVRWHYGSDRLETALRNFFGHEYNHMQMHVAVISPEEVRVLCWPAADEFAVSENLAFDYMQETIEQIENYLGLHMNIASVHRISGIRELCCGK